MPAAWAEARECASGATGAGTSEARRVPCDRGRARLRGIDPAASRASSSRTTPCSMPPASRARSSSRSRPSRCSSASTRTTARVAAARVAARQGDGPEPAAARRVPPPLQGRQLALVRDPRAAHRLPRRARDRGEPLRRERTEAHRGRSSSRATSACASCSRAGTRITMEADEAAEAHLREPGPARRARPPARAADRRHARSARRRRSCTRRHRRRRAQPRQPDRRRRAGRSLHRIAVAGGEFRWWETSARPLETETGRHIVVLLRDVTDRLAAQEERAASRAAAPPDQKLEGLGLLAGGIAHDFNNLMVAVRTNAELARARDRRAARRRASFVDDIGLAAEHARDLTRKLLAYAGRTSTSVETVDFVGDRGRASRSSSAERSPRRCSSRSMPMPSPPTSSATRRSSASSC